MPMTKVCKILSNRRLNADGIELVLEAGELANQAQVGQFVNIKCGEGLLLRRPISICDVDKTAGTLRVVFEVRGEGTAWLAKRPAGHSVDVLGPLGHGFQLPEGKVLVVGGGIGVPPMLYTAKSASKAVAALGFRSTDKVMLTEEFAECCESVHVISDDGSTGRKGFVNVLVQEILAQDSEIEAVLACGPKPMLKTVVEAAQAAGVPCQVSMEERMGCGIGACLVCACKIKTADGERYLHVCKDGPVFRAEEVCWE
jgi:dihydroorotate dehydrogenase electron transfer subunit